MSSKRKSFEKQIFLFAKIHRKKFWVAFIKHTLVNVSLLEKIETFRIDNEINDVRLHEKGALVMWLIFSYLWYHLKLPRLKH